jgi:hypothetical protein
MVGFLPRRERRDSLNVLVTLDAVFFVKLTADSSQLTVES